MTANSLHATGGSAGDRARCYSRSALHDVGDRQLERSVDGMDQRGPTWAAWKVLPPAGSGIAATPVAISAQPRNTHGRSRTAAILALVIAMSLLLHCG